MKSIPFFIGVGDIHEQPARLAHIPDLAACQALIISGDLTTHGGPQAAGRVLDRAHELAPKVLAQPGNMDGPSVHSLLRETGVDIHAKGMAIDCMGCPGDVALMGVGTSTPTPFGTPNEHPETQIEAWLEQAHSQVPASGNLLLVAHDPPYDTRVDMVGGRHVGCRAVRDFIERVQPDVCLCGHIHESPGIEMLGRTLVINPGPLPSGGYALIRFEGDRLTASLERC